MVPVIAFTGKARTGKDTAADVLRKTCDYVRYGFADPIRDMLQALRIDHRAIDDKEAPIPRIGKSLRECMQTLGTEWGRELIHPDLWVIVARDRIGAHRLRGRNVVIPDVRFENEAIMVKSMGGTIVRITREDVESVREHKSEDGIPDKYVDVTLDNDSSIEQFLSRVVELPY